MLGPVKARVAALFALCSAGPAFAAAPELINYQGRLTDGTNLVQGTVAVVFAIHTNASGGGELYADTQTVAVVDGLYAAAIGASNPPNGALRAALARPPCYLQVSVDGTPLAPRERIGSVGYALHAAEPARECFFPARSDGGGVTELVGSHCAVRVMPGAATYFAFRMPDHMAAVSNAVLLGIPAVGSGTDVRLDATYGGVGEPAVLHSNQVATTIAPVAGNVTAISLTNSFAAASPGDACGLRVSHPAGTGADMRYLGIVLWYSTE